MMRRRDLLVGIAASAITAPAVGQMIVNRPRVVQSHPPGLRTHASQTASAAPLHARTVFLGDSITSQTYTVGNRNYTEWALAALNGRVRRAPNGDQGIAGNTMVQMLARIGFTTMGNPNIVVFHGGHNDNRGSIGDTTFMARWTAIYAALRAALPNALLVLLQTLPSTVSGRQAADYAAIWAAQASYHGADDGKTIVVPVPPTFNATTGVHTIDGLHTNVEGGHLVGLAVAAAMDSYVANATKDDILGEITDTGFGFGANANAVRALAGTAGTKSGTVAPTGNVATSCTVANSMTNGSAVAVTCSKITETGFDRQQIDYSGTPAAEALLSFTAGANQSLAIAEGGYYEILARLVVDDGASAAPVGLKSLFLGTTATLWGNSGIDTDIPASPSFPVDFVIRTAPKPLVNPITAVSSLVSTRQFPATVDARMIVDRPILRQVETLAYAVPAYWGNDAVTFNWVAAATGTLGTSGNLTASPGGWVGGNLTFGYEWLRNDVAVATTRVFSQTGNVSGDVIKLRVTATNSFGSTSVTITKGTVA